MIYRTKLITKSGLSINLLLLLFLTHVCFPRARRRTEKFFQLSYYDAESGLYTSGIDDLPFVVFWIVVFTGLRATVMDYILYPLASFGGIKTKKEKVRFAEQAWLLIYYTVFWTLGMVSLPSALPTNVSQSALFVQFYTPKPWATF